MQPVTVTPISGWGWINDGGQTREVPQPFSVAGTLARVWSGLIVSAHHEFEGAHASISDRHAEPDGLVTVEITSADSQQRLAAGYATVALPEGG